MELTIDELIVWLLRQLEFDAALDSEREARIRARVFSAKAKEDEGDEQE
ncbi:MAG: hypothetical protein IKN17_09725 [Ruminococcus sp.]|nr:hypothetical protein [Ruminococcus sp.]MBR6873769.1 hypothetical protein [Ruminococcus sp.]